ncbi:leucocin A/sakacin P family class II bacteriocin [Enterococcus hirae]
MKIKIIKMGILSLVGLIFTFSGIKVSAATYYGNGVYCGAKSCWVNWGQTWSEGLKRWGDNLFGR